MCLEVKQAIFFYAGFGAFVGMVIFTILVFFIFKNVRKGVETYLVIQKLLYSRFTSFSKSKLPANLPFKF